MISTRTADRQEAIKLDILQSLARSQQALARMIESAADVFASSRSAPKQLLGHLDMLARCQITLAEKMTGIRIRTIHYAEPGRVWINPKEMPPVYAGTEANPNE